MGGWDSVSSLANTPLAPIGQKRFREFPHDKQGGLASAVFAEIAECLVHCRGFGRFLDDGLGVDSDRRIIRICLFYFLGIFGRVHSGLRHSAARGCLDHAEQIGEPRGTSRVSWSVITPSTAGAITSSG